MIELFFEVGPGKPRIHVPIQVFIFHIHLLLFHTPFGCSSIYTYLTLKTSMYKYETAINEYTY